MACQGDRRLTHDRDEDLSAGFRDLPRFIHELEGHQFLEEILRALPRDREHRHACRERNRGVHSVARYTPQYEYEGQTSAALTKQAAVLALLGHSVAVLLAP